MDKQRQQWIDVLRGMGIVLVVWGHVYGGYSFDLIFLFHMPLFFFISGMLFKPVDDLHAFWRRKAWQLLLPYTIFLLAIGALLCAHLWWSHPRDPAALRSLLLDMFLGGSYLSAWLAAFWFVTAFFAVLLIEAVLVGRHSPRTLLVLHAAMLVLAWAKSAWLPAVQVPWALDVALAAAPFFYAGYLYRQRGAVPWLDRLAWLVAALAVSLVLANHHYGWQLDLGYDMKVAHYGMPGLTFVAALACCICMVPLAQAIARQPSWLSAGLAELGRAAIIILFMHMVFTMGVAALAGEQHRLARVLAGLAGSYLVYRASVNWAWSRALLLGSVDDLQVLRGRRTMHG